MRTVTCVFAVLMTGSAQGDVIVTEDFESLTSGNLHGQGGWTVTNSGSPLLTTSRQEGSLSGRSFFSDDAVGGIAHRHDGFNYVTAADTQVTLSFSGRMGSRVGGGARDQWSRVGVGYFDGTDYNHGVLFGSNGNTGEWVANSALSTDGFVGPESIWDLRLTIDLVGKTGTLEVEDSEDAGINWFTPSGMDGFSLAELDFGATDGTNPLNWNSLYIRSIAIGDSVDNISFSSSSAAVPEPSSLLVLALGSVFGFVWRRRRRSVVA